MVFYHFILVSTILSQLLELFGSNEDLLNLQQLFFFFLTLSVVYDISVRLISVGFVFCFPSAFLVLFISFFSKYLNLFVDLILFFYVVSLTLLVIFSFFFHLRGYFVVKIVSFSSEICVVDSFLLIS